MFKQALDQRETHCIIHRQPVNIRITFSDTERNGSWEKAKDILISEAIKNDDCYANLRSL